MPKESPPGPMPSVQKFLSRYPFATACVLAIHFKLTDQMARLRNNRKDKIAGAAG
jgi:hypothetical protein